MGRNTLNSSVTFLNEATRSVFLIVARHQAIVLTMCDPAVKGWVPFWFPALRTSRQIESRAAYEEVRLEWFDKAFRHFAGARWPLRGSVAEQMRTVADTLRLIYRAACDDATLELDNLLP